MNRKQSDHLMMVIMIMTFLIIILFSLVKVNSVVHGQGIIATKDNTQIVSLSKGGTIEEIFVSERDVIKKGQILARVSNLDVQKEYDRYFTQSEYLKKSIEELTKVLSSENKITALNVSDLINKDIISNIQMVKSQIRTKEVKITGLSSDINGLNVAKISKKSELGLLQEEINILSPLVKKGISSYTNLLDKKQSAVRLNSELIDLDNQISSKKDEVDFINSEMNNADYELRNSLSKDLAEAQKELAMCESTIKILSRQLQETNVKSPIDGVIYQINKSASTKGGVIQPADALFEIKPFSTLMQAEVKVMPKDRDQVFIGGKVNINVLSFMMSGTKPYKGTIEQISPDSYEESVNGSMIRYYKVIVKFEIPPQDLIKIMPGMTVDANIITGRHSIMKYLMSPLTKGMRQMFSEPLSPAQRNAPEL
ncbi:HlyD family type I secretion periplasmic adaptor subunit [Rahnella sp. C60]|uniref:HlyD family type I secretion periplasmic adaptor subunit n=1 Tax=Rahnella perminowiae TaxID=2816244 RepID=UPI001C280A56|nr:HlyD family type I secretion periplasmic adaptor subunit [Rahnella perminowiae]MBU9811139.1 HlyD family type I secretion periplasmic adaptor subunit [Rahnella perminowiae]MBU9815550.1 HlyD family type I secretion periplasmic adaptor subunit [Rahnella perminowiae]